MKQLEVVRVIVNNICWLSSSHGDIFIPAAVRGVEIFTAAERTLTALADH